MKIVYFCNQDLFKPKKKSCFIAFAIPLSSFVDVNEEEGIAAV
jgi:hypothetical protein